MQVIDRDATGSSAESEEQTEFENRLCTTGIMMKKQIVKIKKSKSKNFKQRPLVIMPIYQNRQILNHMYLLFGYVDIETQYKDFTCYFESNHLIMNELLISVCSMEKKNNSSMLELKIQPKTYSGLKDFQFLIDHYSQASDKTSKDMYEQLIQYQEFCRRYQLHYEGLQSKIKSRIVSEEDILKAIKDYEEYVDSYLKSNHQESDLLIIGYCNINIEQCDVQISKYKLSYSLLSLLGIEPGSPSETELFHSLGNITQMIGIRRLETSLLKLKTYVNFGNTLELEQTFLTADFIEFSAKLQVQIIDWPNKPDFLEKYDIVASVLQIRLSPTQIQSIFEIRAQQTTEEANMMSPYVENYFEYVVQQEIFLEKFYPEIFSNEKQKKRKSLKFVPK